MLLNKIEKFIKYIVTDEGFTINDKKTRYLSNDVKKTVTGITINDDSIHVDKKFKRDLRAQIYCSIKLKDYQNNSQILGKIAYVNSIEKGFRDKIIRYITKLITKTEFAGNIDVVNAFNDNKLFTELPDMVFEEVYENPFE